jgi:hypothetical protein
LVRGTTTRWRQLPWPADFVVEEPYLPDFNDAYMVADPERYPAFLVGCCAGRTSSRRSGRTRPSAGRSPGAATTTLPAPHPKITYEVAVGPRPLGREPGDVASYASVRGRNVSFVVADDVDDQGAPTGAISTGFFALSDLDGGDKAKARKRGGVRSRPKVPRAPRGGTATVPSEAAPERGTAETEPAGPEQPGTGPAPGAVPDNLSELNADDTAALFADAPEGVDLGAVLAAEQARDNPRLTVLRAAEKAGVG